LRTLSAVAESTWLYVLSSLIRVIYSLGRRIVESTIIVA